MFSGICAALAPQVVKRCHGDFLKQKGQITRLQNVPLQKIFLTLKSLVFLSWFFIQKQRVHHNANPTKGHVRIFWSNSWDSSVWHLFFYFFKFYEIFLITCCEKKLKTTTQRYYLRKQGAASPHPYPSGREGGGRGAVLVCKMNESFLRIMDIFLAKNQHKKIVLLFLV